MTQAPARPTSFYSPYRPSTDGRSGVGAYAPNGSAALVPAYADPAEDADKRRALPVLQRNGTHRYVGADDKYDVQTHVPSVDGDGWNMSNKDFSFRTRLRVAPTNTKTGVNGATLRAFHESTVEEPLVWAQYSVDDLLRIFEPSILNNLDRFMTEEGPKKFNVELEKTFIVAIRVVQRNSGGLPFDTALVYVEETTDADGKTVYEVKDSLNCTFISGPGGKTQRAIDVILQRGSGPTDDKLFDYHYLHESIVLGLFGGKDQVDYKGLVLEHDDDHVLLPVDSPLIADGSILLPEDVMQIPKKGKMHYLIKKADVDVLAKEQRDVQKHLPRTNITKGRFVFVRADGRSGATEWKDGTKYACGGQAPPETCTFAPSFDFEIVYMFPEAIGTHCEQKRDTV